VASNAVALRIVPSFLTRMGKHVEQDVTDMPVCDLIEHLLRMANARHQPRSTEKTQVMANE